MRSDTRLCPGRRLHLKLSGCDWSNLKAEWAELEAEVAADKPAVMPLPWLGISGSPEMQLKCASLHVRRRHPGADAPLWNGERYGHDRIRVGYLSADLHNHAVASLIAEMFECHDRTRFETFAFSFGPDDGSPMRARLAGSFEHFFDVAARSDREFASLVRDNEVDVAVDLIGFTENSRANVMAQRPAPLQANFLGYPGTMGAPYIDYIIADHVVIPAEHQPFYTEKIAYLPHCYQPTDTTRPVAAAPLSGAMSDCRTTPSCSARSTTTTRSRRMCSKPG